MANETLITDLVAQEALDQLADLDRAMEETYKTFADVGKELAKGLKIPVEVQGDLDKITQVYDKQMQRAAQATQQLTSIQQQQAQVIANTTNTISRQLAEQEKLNKATREASTEQGKQLAIVDRTLGTYEQNIAALAIMKATPNWVNVALVAAMGAVQMATALAQPIKAYKEGTKGVPHPGGLAVVGDGGKQEIVAYGRNVWLTPDTPTLVDLPRGAQVFPEITQAAIEQLGASLPTSVPRDTSTGAPVIINDYTDLQNQVIASTKALARELRMQSREMSKAMRQQAFAEYLKRRL